MLMMLQKNWIVQMKKNYTCHPFEKMLTFTHKKRNAN